MNDENIYKIVTTDTFDNWFEKLKNIPDRSRIADRIDRIDRIKEGNLGDAKPVGNGIFELRFHFGSGYRIYFIKQYNTIIILLCGGNKKTQDKDIKKAKEIASEVQDG
ncbi:MAG: type II toxin-antitoxin system RelE/ParE family toxin [Leptospirales bacterium]|nr:type II toxin-antitoxin system RelE/ParE family toxin [Leptospirales bacterium]